MTACPVPSDSASFDVREVGRIVGGLVLAGGNPPPGLIERANRSLARLNLPALGTREAVVSSPEELAPLVPPEARGAVADILVELAGNDPLQRRYALKYVALWKLDATQVTPTVANAKPIAAERFARAVIGELPRHQKSVVITGDILEKKDDRMNAAQIYRSNEPEALRAAPVVDPLRARVARVRHEMLQVIAAVDKVVIGKSDAVSRVVTTMAARGHVLLVDAPGVGKTLLCKTIAAALGARFGRVQLTPDLMPMDVTGTTIYDAQAQKFVFRPGPVFTNFLLADEINRATPKTQSALLEVMEERTVTIDGTTHRMADPFQVLATMNPLDHEGTYPLPAAQIDRFMVMLELGYPSPEDEVRVLDTHLAGSGVDGAAIAPVIPVESFAEWQRTVPMIHASPEVKRAAVAYVDGLRRTAPNGHAISPRATLAWMRAAQARAILAGREFVMTEDLLDCAPEILRHRLWMSGPEVRDRLRAMTGAVR